MRLPEISVKPEVMLLEDVLNEIGTGTIRIPKFQRPFVWRPEQMLELFDSIERGYPIGSLLLWQTDEPVEHLAEIGGLPLPEAPVGGSTTYVLDGHQRLSTLYGTLRRPTARDVDSSVDWAWNIHRDLNISDGRSIRFAHWKNGNRPAPLNLLPMRAVLRTMDFLRFARTLENAAVEYPNFDLAATIDEAELVAQRLKSYKLSIIRLVGGQLDQAVEVFSRLNSSGASISPDQMVSALTYQGGESLGDRISLMQDGLAALGYSDLGSKVIFRAILAAAGEEDILDTRWEALARRLEGELSDATDLAERSMVKAVNFLSSDLGVTRSRLLPYSIQLVLLSTFFAFVDEPTPNQLAGLKKWFWTTSWSGYFASANTTQVKSDLRRMKEFARGELDELSGEPLPVRPFPKRFDLRSARVRCFLIWFYDHFDAPLDSEGEAFDPMRLLDEADARAFRHVVAVRTAAGSSPANRVIFPTPPGQSVKVTLLRLTGDDGVEVAERSGIPSAALRALHAGLDSDFIRERAIHLERLEGEFIAQFGAHTDSEDFGPEIDVD